MARHTPYRAIAKLRAPLILAALISGGLAAPASAEVSPNRNLEINHSIEFAVLEGWPAGQDIRVDVLRGATVIATATGEPSGSGVNTVFEVNHVGNGDCWDGVPAGTSPDVKPGDKVVVTRLADPTDVDYTFVRDIAFAENLDGSITGHARGMETAPGVFNLATPVDTVANVMEAKRVNRPTVTDYAFGPADFLPGGTGDFANVAVGGTPGAGELFIDYLDESAGGGTGTTVTNRDGDDASACGPRVTTALTSVSHSVVNLANVGTNLIVSGPRNGATTVTDVVLGDQNPVGGITNGADTWSATIPASALAALANNADHNLVVSFSDGSPNETRTIRKDVTAPVVTSSLAPGDYVGARSTALASNGGEVVRYTLDGSLPGAASNVYTGTPLALGVGTHTIRAYSTDAAGNRTDATFGYVISSPPAAAVVVQQQAAAPAPAAAVLAPQPEAPTAPQGEAAPSRRLSLNGLFARRSLGLAEARRGIRVTALVRSMTRPVGSGASLRTSITGGGLRRLRPGSYEIEATPGLRVRSLGETTTRKLKIVR